MCLHPDMQRLLRDKLGWPGYVTTDSAWKEAGGCSGVREFTCLL